MGTLIKRWSEAESFTIFENHVHGIKKYYVCHKMCQFLAPNLIPYVIAIGLIKNPDTGSYFCHKMCQFLALNLIQYVIAIGTIKNLDID